MYIYVYILSSINYVIDSYYTQDVPGYAVLSVNEFQSHEQYSNYHD